MEIKLIENKTIWDEFFISVGSPSFHHAWEWGDFQISQGREIMRLGLYKGSDLEAIALVVKIRSKRGDYLLIPHGPIFNIKTTKLTAVIPDNKKEEVMVQLKEIINYLKIISQKENYAFIRVAPIFNRDSFHDNLMKSAGLRTAPIYIHAETMLVIDLIKSEDEILNNMRKNHRYYIRKAIREGLAVTKHTNPETFDDFWELYKKTADRENFIPYSKSYIDQEFRTFNKYNNAIYFISGFHNSPENMIPPKFAQEGLSKKIAGSLVLFTDSSGFYHQGASVHTQYPAAYLLQWESILEAKKRGCQFYSLHGIYDPGRTPKAWQGLSLFKSGFGGFQVNYLYTHDFVVSPLSYLYSFAVDKYLSFKRGI